MKTRLTPPLAPHEAAELNSCFLADVADNIRAAARASAIDGFAAFHPPGAEPFFRSLLPGFELLEPEEAGIGRALYHSARRLLAMGYGSACLVNADSPNLPAEHLVQAAALLDLPGDRLVLGPSDDGGYYLIGLKRFHPRLFEDITWSTAAVLDETLERADEIGLETVLLPPWYDVDDMTTLLRLADDLFDPAGTGSAAPRTTMFLNRLAAEGRLDARSRRIAV